MLPSVQMQQHHMVFPPSTFDHLSTTPTSETNYVNNVYPQEGSIPCSRPFPIRTLRAPRRASISSGMLFPASAENHLRRKTPRGTIDAGYDGSPTQLSQGPPPFKQVILPGPSTSIQHPIAVGTSLVQRKRSRAFDQQPLSNEDEGLYNSFKYSSIDASNWGMNNYNTTQYGSLQVPTPGLNVLGHHYQNHAHLDTNATSSNIYQSVIRANEYNVRAFCPPPTAVNDSFSPGLMSIQNNAAWNRRNMQQDETGARSVWNNHDSSLSNWVMPKMTIQPPLYAPNSHYPNSNSSQTSYLRLENLTLDSCQHTPSRHSAQASGYANNSGFRERALLQAYRSYMELLNYVQAARRLYPNRGNARSSLYPKPPRPVMPSLFTNEKVRTFQQSLSNSTDLGKVHQEDSWGTDHTALLSHTNSQRYKYNQHPIEEYGDFRRSNHGASFFSEPLQTHQLPGTGAQQLVNAKSSLALITNLCEQSGWKWIDGLTIGGCLHYGLDQYDEALEWFSRITNLDSSHVEAITNMAATLYCLNRQKEAEQQWLRAVRLRPSHLEAVEHLVGLLYKTRSEEAIEIIDHVQKALLLPPSEVSGVGSSQSSNGIGSYSQPQTYKPTLPGFGSSGYAIPGKENGRILALIHAKGTMHYSQKDVGRASRAFEEAVLISTGHLVTDIQDLVQRIQTALSSPESPSALPIQMPNQPRPLLLAPERARHTAHLVFGQSGDLPGLRHVVDSASKRAAIQTTSNSLLSLAKIFQDAMSGGGAIPRLLRRPAGVGDILSLYYLSLSLQESPSTANNVGILLAGIQQGASTNTDAGASAYLTPGIPGIAPGSGLALALAYYHYGLRLDPKHVHLHTNLGSLLKDIGQLDLAIQMYEQAVACDGSFDIALTNLANAVKDRGRIHDAITYYKRAVDSNPDFAEAVCGLMTALNSVCDWRGRGGVFLQAGAIDRWHVDQKGLLIDATVGKDESGLAHRVVQIVGKQLNEASFWGNGILNDVFISSLTDKMKHLFSTSPGQVEKCLRSWAGKPWEGTRLTRLVERATRVTQWQWYRDKYIAKTDSASVYRRPRLHPSLAVPSAPTVLPFHTFTCPITARDIRRISQRNAIRISSSTLRLSWIPETVYPPPPPPNPHLNVGYVSSDFNNHPLAHLMQSVFGFHNPQRVKAFCYATTASDKSVHRQQIEREAPVFRDVSNWPPERLVEQIVRDNIHILVNLNGYTRGARNEIFAARPAPIQMSFMGFAGTLGAEWCDYILADSTAIPTEALRPWRTNVSIEDVFHDRTEGDEEVWMYSENIIFCRDTFFCCDHAQSCGPNERTVTWKEEQQRRWKMRKELFPTLPDDMVILGNFNQLYKIEPTVFRTWLRILARTPKAVLWLLRFPELGETNLRRTAKAWAGQEVASRLLFTDVAPKNQHISRARVCDLFLDTPECNAHTTAADVLWSSTPLLTLPRYSYKMCSRMAASILKGAFPKTKEGERAACDLTAKDDADYEKLAIELANELSYRMSTDGCVEGTGRLAELRKLLWDSKWTCGLFDTRRWVSDVELAYQKAWQRWVAGEGGDIYL